MKILLVGSNNTSLFYMNRNIASGHADSMLVKIDELCDFSQYDDDTTSVDQKEFYEDVKSYFDTNEVSLTTAYYGPQFDVSYFSKTFTKI